MTTFKFRLLISFIVGSSFAYLAHSIIGGILVGLTFIAAHFVKHDH